MHYLAYGWLGVCAGIGGLMQAHYAQEIVPNALYGRELEVLAASSLAAPGSAAAAVRFSAPSGPGSVSITQNGLNLLGVSPYAFA